MKVSRPSPALVISIVALVVAATGTATAAGVFVVKDSSQVRAQSITGSDVKNGSLTGLDIADGSISAKELKEGVLQSALPTAREVFKKTSPAGLLGVQTLATLPALTPGTYVIFAKTTLGPPPGDNGLLDAALKQNKTVVGRCALNAAGDEDVASGKIVSPGSQEPVTLNMQLTRTIAEPGDVKLVCAVGNVGYQAADTSIIAIQLAASQRTEASR
jgi:hypothetical protein